MKPSHLLIPFLMVLLALFNVPLLSQESVPKPTQEPAENPDKPAASTEPDSANPDRTRVDRSRPPPPAEKLTSFIGVLTDQVRPELRAQIGLPEGFGLQVVEVMPESPAKEAGLKVHDILVRFDDQRLVNTEQLQALVRDRKEGDEVTLTVVTGGKETTLALKVGERMMAERPEEPRRPTGRFFQPGFGHQGGRMIQPGAPMSNLQESLERFQNRLREYQERLQQWSRDGSHGPMPTPPVLETLPQPGPDHRPGPSQAERRERSSHRSVGVTRQDDSGIYSLQKGEDRSTFTVRPNGGGEQSWTFNHDTRSMVPEQYRDKLRMLEELAEETVRDEGRGGSSLPRREPRTGDGRKPPTPSQEPDRRDAGASPRPKRGDTL